MSLRGNWFNRVTSARPVGSITNFAYTMSLQPILDDCGLTITRYEPVYGGDINRCWCLHTHDLKYFLKVNDAGRYPVMFEKEAGGLQALRDNCSITIPKVIQYGIAGHEQYLLLEWIEKGSPKPDCPENLGAGLAMLHQKAQPWFGWEEDNYIGSLPQCNTKHPVWHLFYSECRIMPLVQRLFDTGAFSKHDVSAAAFFCKRLDQLFPPESPSLLHGDLWSGNYMVSASGYAALFDPSVYYGHREMDLGMTRLFGGFDARFYQSYHEVYPLEKGWQQRLPLTQLYPLLVHAVLFGGHYVGSAREIIRGFHG
jgi:fructosamine-3-kinase